MAPTGIEGFDHSCNIIKIRYVYSKIDIKDSTLPFVRRNRTTYACVHNWCYVVPVNRSRNLEMSVRTIPPIEEENSEDTDQNDEQREENRKKNVASFFKMLNVKI